MTKAALMQLVDQYAAAEAAVERAFSGSTFAQRTADERRAKAAREAVEQAIDALIGKAKP